ncbi:hypothetical protein M3Y97_01087400 [Aphelenchoides bicaudatus]|nr:hypothetical protein M3Y97_01087400 [Aphelenchoides bicaudatus]
MSSSSDDSQEIQSISNRVTVRTRLPRLANVKPYKEKNFLTFFRVHVHKLILPICVVSVFINSVSIVINVSIGSREDVIDPVFVLFCGVFAIFLYFILGIANRKKILFVYYLVPIVFDFLDMVLIFIRATISGNLLMALENCPQTKT